MACEPTLLEPNQSLEMEIADYINTKKSNWYAPALHMLTSDAMKPTRSSVRNIEACQSGKP